MTHYMTHFVSFIFNIVKNKTKYFSNIVQKQAQNQKVNFDYFTKTTKVWKYFTVIAMTQL